LIEQVRAVSRDAQTSPATPRTPQVSPAAVANAQDGDAPELPVPQTTEQPRSTASQSTTGDSRPVITSTQQGSDTGQFGTNSGNQGQNRDLATHLAAMVATKGDSVSSETLAQSKSESDPALALQTSQGGRTDALATFRPALAAYNQAAQTINLPQIGFEIARQALNGTNRFQIQLDPPELGRIDVRMDLDRNGSLHARLTVDRSETLDLLQRDARTLERALSQAGLDGSRTSLEFTLRQDTQGRHGGKADDSLADIVDTIGDIDPDDAAPPIIHYRGTASPGGINLWV
jgi:flagellar hook-length control protein FliK